MSTIQKFAYHRTVALGGVAAKAPSFLGLSGIFVGVIAVLALLSGSPVVAAAAITTSWIIARQATEYPAMGFGLLTCALYPTVGLAFFGAYGRFPGGLADSDYIYSAFLIFYAGLLSMIFGYRTLSMTVKNKLRAPAALWQSVRIPALSQHAVVIAILVVFSLEWLGFRPSFRGTGGYEQILKQFFDFRFVLLGYYFILVFNLREAQSLWKCGAIALYVAIPASSSHMSGWSGIFIFGAIIGSYALTVLNQSAPRYLLKHPSLLAACLVGVAAFLSVALVWQSGLKSSWRARISEGNVSTSPFDRLGEMNSLGQKVVLHLDYESALESTAARMSSGMGIFSFVVDRRMHGMPTTDGALVLSATKNLVPRFIYPGKADLGGDSWIVNRFAGLNVAGDAQGTSIGLGFIPEFFIDFDVQGVLLCGFMYGAIFGLCHYIMRRSSGSLLLADLSFLVLIYTNGLVYDASIVKNLSSSVHKTMVFAIFLYAIKLACAHQILIRTPIGWRKFKQTRVSVERT